MLNAQGNYAMYLRKSRADQEAEARGQYETLAKHEQILRAVADREGISVSTIFRELVSGDTIADRPEMQKLLKDVRSGIYDGVLVTEISRLARGRTSDQAAISEAFAINNTLIITPGKIYYPSNDADETFLDFELFMARQEYKYIRKRMKAGKDQALRSGSYIMHRAPFGFDRDIPNKSLTFNDDMPFAKQLCEDFAEGSITVSEAVRKIRAYTGKDTWGYRSVRSFLCNPANCGLSEINVAPTVTYTKADGTIGKKRVRNPHPDIVKARWEGFISEETHEKILDRFGRSPRRKRDTELKNPFAGLMYCAHCGRIMAYHFGNRARPVIRHIWGNENRNKCQCASADIQAVMLQICDAMDAKLKDESASLLSGNDPDISLAPLLARRDEAEKKRQDIYRYFEQGIYDAEEFKTRRLVYTKQIDDLDEQIEKIRNREEKKPRILSITTREAVAGLRWEDCPAELRNEFLKSVFEKIEYWRDDKEAPVMLTYHWRF